MQVEFFPEYCCEHCGEVTHNHFECPECKHNYAPTSIYHDIDLKEDTNFYCCRCNTKFRFISKVEDECDTYIIEKI